MSPIELPKHVPNMVIDMDFLCNKKHKSAKTGEMIAGAQVLMEFLTPPEGYYEAVFEAMKRIKELEAL